MFHYAEYIVWVIIAALLVSAIIEIARLVMMLRDRSSRKRKAAKRHVGL